MIAIIIIGGLIIFSIVWCIIRCACCGVSCCCECCYCLKCCGNCLGCCDPPRGKPSKYLDEPYIPPHQGYRAPAPMAAGPIAAPAYKAPVQDTPQFATFDVSKTAGHEDALPAMPSWQNASKTKVMLEEDEVEMDNLKKPDNTSQTAPLLNPNATSPSPASPNPLGGPRQNSPNQAGPYGRSPSPSTNNFGAGGHPAVANGYLAAGAVPGGSAGTTDPYGRTSPNYDSQQQTGILDYGAPQGNDFGYGAPGMAPGMGPGRRSPGQFSGRQPGYGGSPMPPPQQQGGYGRNDQGGNYRSDYYDGNNTPQGYGIDRRSPRMPEVGMGGNGGSEYGSGNTGRYDSPGPYGVPSSRTPPNRPPMNNRPPPQRQYAGSAIGNGGSPAYSNPGNSYRTPEPEMPPSPPLQNSGGFDFSSGYSRPSTRGQEDYGNNGKNGYNSPPAQSQPGRDAYPPYRGYRG